MCLVRSVFDYLALGVGDIVLWLISVVVSISVDFVLLQSFCQMIWIIITYMVCSFAIKQIFFPLISSCYIGYVRYSKELMWLKKGHWTATVSWRAENLVFFLSIVTYTNYPRCVFLQQVQSTLFNEGSVTVNICYTL